ncbi:MAG: FAD/NAD(P)-binding protein [Mycetocola sp.]
MTETMGGDDGGSQSVDVAVVGAGPKSVAFLERLAAHLAHTSLSSPVSVLLIDPHDAGAGKVWRTGQSRALLNNTPASATTAFADESVPSAAPVAGGPSLAEWCARPELHRGMPADMRSLARTIRPWSPPPRALQGWYYRWALESIIARAAPTMTVTHRRATVLGVEAQDTGLDRLELDHGPDLRAALTVFAPGFLDDKPSRDESGFAELAGGRYLPPGMADVSALGTIDWSRRVAVRGLGATFFDLVGLLVSGEVASGQRPMLSVSSGAGLPKRAQPGVQLPPVEARVLTAGWAERTHAAHAGKRTLSADTVARQMWEEIEGVFAGRPVAGALRDPGHAALSVLGQRRTEPMTANEWAEVVRRFIAQERLGITDPEASPWLAARDLLFRVRSRVQALRRANAFDSDKAVDRLLVGPISRVTSGPPAGRMAEFADLIDEGRIDLVGPGVTLNYRDGVFQLGSSLTGRVTTAWSAIEAWQRYGSLDKTADPLLRSLRDAGAVAAGRWPGGVSIRTGEGARLLRPAGPSDLNGSDDLTAWPNRWALGRVAAADQQGVHQGAVPGIGDPFLVEADAAARDVASVLRGLRAQADPQGSVPGVTQLSPAT